MSDHIIDEMKMDIENWRCLRVIIRRIEMKYSAGFHGSC
jgi:hypothetical protein